MNTQRIKTFHDLEEWKSATRTTFPGMEEDEFVTKKEGDIEFTAEGDDEPLAVWFFGANYGMVILP